MPMKTQKKKKKSENDMICKMLKYKQLLLKKKIQTLKCKNVLKKILKKNFNLWDPFFMIVFYY